MENGLGFIQAIICFPKGVLVPRKPETFIWGRVFSSHLSAERGKNRTLSGRRRPGQNANRGKEQGSALCRYVCRAVF
ncbi:MAG: hypothetical protein CW346_07380 [Bacillaceae bacterium]|nr:hypothetical protein [Bacillaceae bacterium]